MCQKLLSVNVLENFSTNCFHAFRDQSLQFRVTFNDLEFGLSSSDHMIMQSFSCM